ncbi:peroxidase [Selaginella moellendorffii]|uniref:peroxidase n=1 Tax=Selaginella moellendorffii TaxID=88036 RepID=UPI000D1C9E71|nr:peroxidase [Selaginella moellendorffii]|eukprot:XP_024542586.1 peroxidase [Selaginella moellendorffii]
MASLLPSKRLLLLLFVIALLVLSGDAATKKKKVKKSKAKKVKAVTPAPSAGGMSLTFYNNKCSSFAKTVSDEVAAAMKKDPTIAAGLLRMHFHDCWVRGCDASVLLSGPNSERQAGPNLSLRGFQVIDTIKSKLERSCRGVVSCADILTQATRDAVVKAGGPSWDVPLGRKDGRVSSAAEVQLPAPSESTNSLISKFNAKQLSVSDLVALSGAHSFGFGNCGFFQSRITSRDPTLNSTYAQELQRKCQTSASVANDPITQNTLDNQYYKNLQQRKGLFTSDEGLFFHPQTKPLVDTFASNPVAFAQQFRASMAKLITLPPFQSNTGGIRTVCSIAK